jgi:hypothetical protein
VTRIVAVDVHDVHLTHVLPTSRSRGGSEASSVRADSVAGYGYPVGTYWSSAGSTAQMPLTAGGSS